MFASPSTTATENIEHSTDEDVHLLTIILDLNPFEWGRRRLLQRNTSSSSSSVMAGRRASHSGERQLLTLEKCISQLFVFIHSYLISDHRNKIAVIGTHSKGSQFLYPVEEGAQEEEREKAMMDIDSSVGGPSSSSLESDFDRLQRIILQQIRQLGRASQSNGNNGYAGSGISDGGGGDHNGSGISDGGGRDHNGSGGENASKAKGSSLAGALSMALCYLNRMEREKALGSEMFKRVLVLQVSKDVSTQYISFMNAIFCAQKMNATVDVCYLSPLEDSSFLQQAAFITGGVYLKPRNQEGLLQYLLSVFMVDMSLRQVVQLPIQYAVEFRAMCFDTKKPTDQGYVCSVCLSIFSEFTSVCSTCGTKIRPPSLANLRAASSVTPPSNISLT